MPRERRRQSVWARLNIWLLQAGVTAATAVVILGGLLYLLRHGGEPVGYDVFSGEPSNLRGLPGIVYEATHLSSRGIIQFGLGILVTLQAARVALSAVLFGRARDLTYTVVSLVVLAIVLYSLVSSGTTQVSVN